MKETFGKMEQYYVVYRDGKKVGTHLSREKAQELKRKLDVADRSWGNRSGIDVISESEDESQESLKNSIIGKTLITFNTVMGTFSEKTISETERDSYCIHICKNSIPRKTYSYATIRILLNGDYAFDNPDCIISLGMDGIGKYVAKEKEKYETLYAWLIQFKIKKYFNSEEKRVVIKKKTRHYDRRRRG